MGQRVVIRFWWESGLSSASRNHLTTFCRPYPLHMFTIVFRDSPLFPKSLSFLSAKTEQRKRWSHWLRYQFMGHDI